MADLHSILLEKEYAFNLPAAVSTLLLEVKRLDLQIQSLKASVQSGFAAINDQIEEVKRHQESQEKRITCIEEQIAAKHSSAFTHEDLPNHGSQNFGWSEEDEAELNRLLEFDWLSFDSSAVPAPTSIVDQPTGSSDNIFMGSIQHTIQRKEVSLFQPALPASKQDVVQAPSSATKIDSAGETESPSSSSFTGGHGRSSSCKGITSCPRCFEVGHQLRECPNEARTFFLPCCRRWQNHSGSCRFMALGSSPGALKFHEDDSKKLTRCPRCLEFGHKARECPGRAVTMYHTCCSRWRFHSSDCFQAASFKATSETNL